MTLDNLFSALQFAPTGDGRSKIDDWESKISALWAERNTMCGFFFPQGRAPFTTGGRDNILDEVKNLGFRLDSKIMELVLVETDLQAQVDAITATR